MNKPKPIPFLPLSPEQQACVNLLEEALLETKRGAVDSIGLIVCMKDGYASVMAGKRAADLNMGCDSLKRKIIEAVERPQSIIKAPMKGPMS